MPSDVEALAAGLSEAQRAMLLACPVHAGNADKRTSEGLRRRGLIVQRGSIPNRHMPAWPYPAFDATPLGLSVREHLLHPNGSK